MYTNWEIRYYLNYAHQDLLILWLLQWGISEKLNNSLSTFLLTNSALLSGFSGINFQNLKVLF